MRSDQNIIDWNETLLDKEEMFIYIFPPSSPVFHSIPITNGTMKKAQCVGKRRSVERLNCKYLNICLEKLGENIHFRTFDVWNFGIDLWFSLEW